MSDLICRVGEIEEIEDHTNADSLELAIFGGWQICVPLDKHNVGDVVIHIPPDSMVPMELAEKWGVAKYLSVKEGEEFGRVKAIRLRKEMSHGFLVENSDNLALGENARDFYGIQKYEPPQHLSIGGVMLKDNPYFQKYTDIQNLRNFPGVIHEGEIVVATEKIHGTNSRIGLVPDDEHNFILIRGSRNHGMADEGNNIYRQPVVLYPQIEDMLNEIKGKDSAIVYGEIFGWVQDLRYGAKAGDYFYQMFDISVDGEYLDWEDVVSLSERFEIPHVPILYKGAFDEKMFWGIAGGNSNIPGAENLREGIVVKPLTERMDPQIGRVILKMISDEYLERKGGSEYH